MARDRLGIVYLKGLCMGAADVIPGVSGGTIALVTGIYDRLIRALAALDPGPVRALPWAYKADTRRQLYKQLWAMDVPFLVALGAGIGTAVLTLANVVSWLLTAYTAVTFAFFVGLIAASAVLIGADLVWTPRRMGIAAVAAGVVVAVSTSPAVVETHALWVIFLAGMIGISAMMLPGLSGALALLILGQYAYLLEAVQTALAGLLALPGAGASAALSRSGTIVVTFGLGAGVGVLTIAHVVKWALDRDRHTTLAGLVGLMAGGIVPPGQRALTQTELNLAAVGLIAAAGLGAVAIYTLDRLTGDLSYADPTPR